MIKRILLFLIAGAAFAQPPVQRMASIANASSTGTVLNKLAKLTGAPSTAVVTTAGDTSGAIGIVIAGAGTTGNATIQEDGQHTCVFDGATTANHYVKQSASVNGDCTDAGASLPTSGQVVGVVLSTNGGAGTYLIDMALRQAAVPIATPVTENLGGTGANNTTGAAGHVLRSNGTHYVDSAIQTADVPNPLNQNTTGTAGSLSAVLVESLGGTGANNTPGSAGHVLRSNGTHYVDSAIQSGDLPALSTTVNGVTCTIGSTCTVTNTRNIGAAFGSFQSGASALTGSLTACVPTYYSGTITGVELIADVSGSVTVDVKTVAHTSWTGTSSVSAITASAIPALSSAAQYTDTTLTGWTTSLTAGTDVCFVLTSPTTVAGVSVNLKIAVTN